MSVAAPVLAPAVGGAAAGAGAADEDELDGLDEEGVAAAEGGRLLELLLLELPLDEEEEEEEEEEDEDEEEDPAGAAASAAAGRCSSFSASKAAMACASEGEVIGRSRRSAGSCAGSCAGSWLGRTGSGASCVTCRGAADGVLRHVQRPCTCLSVVQPLACDMLA